jgi:hypothetical protein
MEYSGKTSVFRHGTEQREREREDTEKKCGHNLCGREAGEGQSEEPKQRWLSVGVCIVIRDIIQIAFLFNIALCRRFCLSQ